MILIAVATENEIKPLAKFLAAVDGVEVLVTGMGPVAAAVSLGKRLACTGSKIDAVLNIGVAGAYVDSGIVLLDICMAKQEFLGDFGICLQDEILDFDQGISNPADPLILNNDLVKRFGNIMGGLDIAFKTTNFVTVNCCTGTAKRGEFLKAKFGAGCENMEGAAVAMVCQKYDIPCVELRCISNFVENRETTNWRLPEAIEKICLTVEIVMQEYVKKRNSCAD